MNASPLGVVVTARPVPALLPSAMPALEIPTPFGTEMTSSRASADLWVMASFRRAALAG
ncbi:hypothetical protein [Solirubrobacter soli]|uniref:hypothetical protein n=1 Tax=Solirubrobacter soli TaxID=363832 RepID=UPI0012F87900|nr:hypothetical protein [Solirubrobacter soli]